MNSNSPRKKRKAGSTSPTSLTFPTFPASRRLRSHGGASPPPVAPSTHHTPHQYVDIDVRDAPDHQELPDLPEFTRDPNLNVSFIVMGSGGSSAVPDISCVTDPKHGCAGCLKTRGKDKKQAKNNIRGNSGGIIIIANKEDPSQDKCILVDCGKTFREQAIQMFPDKGLRKIDAVILTHAHMDAVGGLDDLRAWTYRPGIQKYIPIYCSKETYETISIESPWFISKERASGGGEIPAFEWNQFDFATREPLVLFGIRITPMPMHHGSRKIVVDGATRTVPMLCAAFLIDASFFYVSDVSFIPPDVWAMIRREISLPSDVGRRSSRIKPRLLALIIDSCAIEYSAAHFGLAEAVETAFILGAERNYLTDLCHGISHEAWVYACERVWSYGTKIHNDEKVIRREHCHWPTHVKFTSEVPMLQYDAHNENLDHFSLLAKTSINKRLGGFIPRQKLWIRPLTDGLTLSWSYKDPSQKIETQLEKCEARLRRVWDDVYVKQ